MSLFNLVYCCEKNKCNDHPEIRDVVPKQAVGKATQTTKCTGILASYLLS